MSYSGYMIKEIEMSLPGPLQSMMEDWFEEFYEMIEKDHPDWPEQKIAALADDLTQERLANDGQYDGR